MAITPCFSCLVLPCCISRLKNRNEESILNFMWKINCPHFGAVNGDATQDDINALRDLFGLKKTY